ncbi:MAG: hypothetical protein ABSC77_10035 [Terracidiphilus sp.]|jgi:hypothetical protein
MKSLRAIVYISVLTAFSAAIAQQPVPPPPKPAADGPTLEATMKFIQTKLSEQGKLNFAIYTHDNVDGKDYTDLSSIEYNNIVADPATCRISYYRNSRTNNTSDGGVASYNLHDVVDLVVMIAEQDWKKRAAAAGHPTWNPRFDPPMFLVMVRRAGNQENGFYFSDEDTANRIAKAMVHAVELCGGGSKEPF